MMNISTSAQPYVPKLRADDDLYSVSLRSMSDQRPSCGFWKMYHRIHKASHVVNHKRLYRIYTDCMLNIRRKSKHCLPKRSQNGYIERFNRTLCEDILDRFELNSVAQTQHLTNTWIWVYNNRPNE